jgi:hypothetical protein
MEPPPHDMPPGTTEKDYYRGNVVGYLQVAGDDGAGRGVGGEPERAGWQESA